MLERLMVALGAFLALMIGWVPPEAIGWLQSRRLGSDPPTVSGHRTAVPASGRGGHLRRRLYRSRRRGSS
jgi:hypothetical protein